MSPYSPAVDYSQYEDIPAVESPSQAGDSLAKNSIGSEDVVDGSPITDDDQFFIDYLIYNLGALPAQ
jgi:hypothetical protein